MLSWLPQRIISVRRRPCWADIIKLIILSSTPALLSEKHMIPFSHPDYMIVLNNICVPSLSLSHSTLSPASPYARPHAALPGCGLIDGATASSDPRSARIEQKAQSIWESFVKALHHIRLLTSQRWVVSVLETGKQIAHFARCIPAPASNIYRCTMRFQLFRNFLARKINS